MELIVTHHWCRTSFVWDLTLSLPSSKLVHSLNLLKEKCISEVVRIGSIIIFYLSKLEKAKFSIQCDVMVLVRR